jgi:hypothetical protein
MTQLSRPYQIALLALGLLVIVWFVALRGHSAATSTGGAGSSPAASTPAPTAASEAKAAAAPTHVYTGPVPGLTGLTRAIAKAHGAVANSQQNAKQVEAESGQGTSSAQTSTSHSAAAAHTTGSTSTHALPSKVAVAKHPSVAGSNAAARVTPSKPSTTGAVAPKTHRSSPNMQARVEAELKQGKIVTILFWNPKAAVDRAVQRELQGVGHALGAKISVHDAHADQVGSFGSITRTIQVDETPTILIVSKGGQTTTLTGLTDVFSIELAIGEAQKAAATK